MKSLLILSCGTNANWLIVRTLREKFPGMFRLIGTDTNPRELVAAAGLLDAFYTVPPSKDESFVAEIEKVVAKEHPDYLLPSFDLDQFLFSSESDLLKRYGVRSLSTQPETLKIYADKCKMHAACVAAGLPVPRRYGVDEVDLSGRYFVKPIHGVASIGAREMSGDEIRALPNSDGVIIQELCHGPERTLECFFYHGCLSSICRDRLATKAGVCTKTRVYKSPRLESIARRFADAFAVPLIFNLQFMENAQSQAVITDVNLRTAGGMGLSYATGWDEVSALAKVLLGRPDDDVFATLPEFMPEQFVVRTYDEKITKTSEKVVAFDLDGTLVDSRQRHQQVMESVLKQHGISLDAGDLVAFKSSNRNNVDYLISKGLDADLAKAIQKDWIAQIESPEAQLADTLYPDALPLLKLYAGWHKILLTARSNESALNEELSRLHLREQFDEVVVVPPGKSASKSKADFLREKKALIFWGDTVSDRQAADTADVAFKFHENGFHIYQTVIGESGHALSAQNRDVLRGGAIIGQTTRNTN